MYICVNIFTHVKYIYMFIATHQIISFVKKLQKNRFTESKYVHSFLFRVIFQNYPIKSI